MKRLTKKTFSSLIFSTFFILYSFSISTGQNVSFEKNQSGESFDNILSKAAGGGDTRVTGSYTLGRYRGENLHGFRGVIDCHLPASGPFFNWSIALTGHFSLNKIDSLSQHFAGAGANLHLFKWYDLDIFGGGAVGFTRVQHDFLETRYPLTLDIHGGWTIYGDLICVSGEIGYRYAEYFSRDHLEYINLSHFYISMGTGIKL